MTKRAIYSIDEATELTQRSKDDLIALGCSGSIQFLIDVPPNAKIGNVGLSDLEEVCDPVIRKLKRQAFHLTPIPVASVDLLVLSQEDCLKLQERGKLRQAVFFRAAVFGPDSGVEIIHPIRPENASNGLGKLHFPMRIFAAYDQNALFQEMGSNVTIPTKELVINASQLHIAAAELQLYLINQKQKTPPQTLPSSKPAKKGRRADELSRVIKRMIYDPATADEKRDDDVLWDKFVSLAKQALPDSLLREFDEKSGNVLYKPSSRGQGKLTKEQFKDRVSRMRESS